MIEKIENNNEVIAIIIYSDAYDPGVKFYSEDNFEQQIGTWNHPKGKIIAPHVHNIVERKAMITQEVVIVKKGKLRVDLYDNNKNYLESVILNKDDTILLATQGHGFKALEDLEVLEVKQGPYIGDRDKIKFDPISDEKVVIRGGKNE